MYELVNAKGNTYYIESPAKIGVYVDGKNAYLIDSGSDKDAGRRCLKVMNEQGWEVTAIINTHSHADHCGGNKFIQDRTGCDIYAPPVEEAFERYPILEPSYLYGGYPMKELQNKFLMAQPSDVKIFSPDALPEGFETLSLPGHYFDMLAVRTPDGVWFLADSVVSAETVEKYHVSFLSDVGAYLDSVEKVSSLEGELFIPSHAAPCEDIKPLCSVNRAKVYEIIALLKEFCAEKRTTEAIIKHVFDVYSLRMDIGQYALNGSTVRSYLSYLHDKSEMDFEFENNILYWHTSAEEE